MHGFGDILAKAKIQICFKKMVKVLYSLVSENFHAKILADSYFWVIF